MDHPCYKCGQSVEDGKAFCAQCGAPQIRVAMPEPAVSSPAGTLPAVDLPAFPMAPSTLSGTLRGSVLSNGVDWRRAFSFCALAALISVIVTSIRLIGPLVAVIGAASLAVLLYYRRNPIPAASARSGAKIGALTGLLSSGVYGVFFAIFVAVLRAGGEFQKQLMEALQQFVTKANDPQVQATFDLLKTPEGLVKMIWGMVGLFLICIAAGGLAGALTGLFLGRRNRS
jgi:hypothetical protein